MYWRGRAVDAFDGRGAGEDDAEVERSDGDGVCAGVSGRRAGVEVDVAAVDGGDDVGADGECGGGVGGDSGGEGCGGEEVAVIEEVDGSGWLAGGRCCDVGGKGHRRS